MENGFKLIPHPPYSHDLAPCDFFLFGYLKDKLVNIHLNGPEELKQVLTELIHEIPSKTKKDVFNSWISRCDDVINADGDYL